MQLSLFSYLTGCSSDFVEIFIGYSLTSSHLGPFSLSNLSLGTYYVFGLSVSSLFSFLTII
jgi:hypothetical protein